MLRSPDHTRRVVVTGLGVISPVGNDKDTAWSNLVNGVSGLGPITYFDTEPYEAKVAGEVQDFDAKEWMDPKAARRSESSLHFGVAAGKQALADSGFELTDENRTEVGVIFGSGAGGQQLMIDNYVSLHDRGQPIRDDRDRDRRDRSQRVHGLRMCDRHAQRRRGG